ncbi:hypothetical protein V493_02428 [Pseudogymnoascus sp. VKM F-4281 (FW-2241)]|nr:hypothetical protein V493_02428 [Pseudogymnoascus sp. VKM F-4281 (FW-2241)]
MSSTSSSVVLLPTLNASPDTTSHLAPSSSSIDSPSVQTITFGILSAVLAVGSIILAYLQLMRMRKERLRVERDCEMN